MGKYYKPINKKIIVLSIIRILFLALVVSIVYKDDKIEELENQIRDLKVETGHNDALEVE